MTTCDRCKGIVLAGDKHECGATPKTDAIAHEMVKRFCQWRYSPMAQGEQPDFSDPVFKAAEWLGPKLRELEREASK